MSTRRALRPPGQVLCASFHPRVRSQLPWAERNTIRITYPRVHLAAVPGAVCIFLVATPYPPQPKTPGWASPSPISQLRRSSEMRLITPAIRTWAYGGSCGMTVRRDAARGAGLALTRSERHGHLSLNATAVAPGDGQKTTLFPTAALRRTLRCAAISGRSVLPFPAARVAAAQAGLGWSAVLRILSAHWS